MTRFRWERVPELRTARLVLRPLTSADAPHLFAIYGDAEVMRFASDPPFSDPAMVDQMLASVGRLFATRESIEWGIVETSAGHVVGTCGLHGFDPALARAEVGCLLARTHWGRGLMREALSAVIAFAVAEFEVGSLLADIDAPNLRSLALFRRLGFTPMGDGSTKLILTLGQPPSR